MGKFQYQWWTVDLELDAGRVTCEYKARSREGAIKQINKEVAYSNSEENLSKPFWFRKNVVKAVYWETLTLDREGYQRRF